MDKQKRDITILGLLLGVAILVGDYYVILEPTFRGFGEKNLRITEIKKLIGEAEILKNEQELIEQKYKKVEIEFERYNKKLPQEKDMPELLSSFNVKAEETGIKFVKVSTEKIINHDAGKGIQYIERPMRVNITSGYHEIGTFLNKIETLPRFVELKGLKISVEDKSKSGKSVSDKKSPEAEFLLSTYTFLDESQGNAKAAEPKVPAAEKRP